MKVYGLTGGIGSGKSIVARIFQVLGVPVYNADDRGKWLMQHDDRVREKIISLFGNAVIKADHSPNYAQIGNIVFNDPEKLEQLNRIIHPAVAEDFRHWILLNKAPLLIKEAAIIFETGSEKQLDGVIVVSAPDEVRIKRVMLRNNLSEEAVKLRMLRQWPAEKVNAQADYLIINDESKLVIPQVLEILDKLK